MAKKPDSWVLNPEPSTSFDILSTADLYIIRAGLRDMAIDLQAHNNSCPAPDDPEFAPRVKAIEERIAKVKSVERKMKLIMRERRASRPKVAIDVPEVPHEDN